jgi:hypothetical protein
MIEYSGKMSQTYSEPIKRNDGGMPKWKVDSLNFRRAMQEAKKVSLAEAKSKATGIPLHQLLDPPSYGMHCSSYITFIRCSWVLTLTDKYLKSIVMTAMVVTVIQEFIRMVSCVLIVVGLSVKRLVSGIFLRYYRILSIRSSLKPVDTIKMNVHIRLLLRHGSF